MSDGNLFENGLGVGIDHQTYNKIEEVRKKLGATEGCTPIFIGLCMIEAMIKNDPDFLTKVKPEIDIIDACRRRSRLRAQGGMQPGQ